jgi:5-methylthioadenosine/S-adenosylhomocysteine deaminase
MKEKISVDHIFKNGIVLSMDENERIIYNGAVAIKAEKIVAIDETAAILENFTARTVTDASNSVIMPGLINAHTHAAMTIFRGIADDMLLEPWLEKIWPLELKYATAENVALGSKLAFAEMIASGTTTATDMYWQCEAGAEAAIEMGFRLLSGTGALDTLDGDNTKEGRETRTRAFIEKYLEHPLITPCAQVHATYTVSRETLIEVRDMAAEYGILFITHASESQHEVEDVREKTGKTPIHYLDELNLLTPNTLLAHAIHLDPEEIDLLAKRGTSIAHCPESNLKLGDGIAHIPEMLTAGVNVSLGTDGAASNNDLDMWGEIHTTALIHKGTHLDPRVVPAVETLKMATINGAKAINLEEKIGSLEPGKLADIIIVDLGSLHLTPIYNIVSHLAYSAKGCDVKTVMIHGKFVMKDRKLLTVDVEKLKHDTQALAEKMLKSQ